MSRIIHFLMEGKQLINFDGSLLRFFLSYSTIPHCGTSRFTAELLCNRKLNTRLNLINPRSWSTLQNHEEYFHSFTLTRKLCVVFIVEGKVIEKISNVIYNVQLDFNNAIIHRHVDQLHHMPNTDDIYEKDCFNSHDLPKNCSSHYPELLVLKTRKKLETT